MILNKFGISIFSKGRFIEPDRPLTRPEYEPVDWLLEILALLTLFSFLGYVIYIYQQLPDIIPTHFNAAGLADDYGGKNDIWMLPGVTVLLYFMLTLVNFIPHKFNYPTKITPQNAVRQYALATRLIRILKVVIMVMFFYIGYATVSVSYGKSSGIGVWFIPVFLGFVFIPMIIYFIRSSKK